MAGLADGTPYGNDRRRDGRPISLPYAGQPYFCSEFGGIWWNPEAAAAGRSERRARGATASGSRTRRSSTPASPGLVDALLDDPLMFGYCYTQLTDVFQEQNGIYRFDRADKLDVDRIRASPTSPRGSGDGETARAVRTPGPEPAPPGGAPAPPRRTVPTTGPAAPLERQTMSQPPDPSDVPNTAPLRPARFTLDPAFSVGDVDPRLFGSFVEHLGRCVYTGIYEPGHPTADEDGFRSDVLELVRELGVTVVRYPGGNFVSGYRWEDGVGPRRASGPRRLDLAWRRIETNAFGLDEFIAFVHEGRQVEPMMAVNLGTRGVAEALRPARVRQPPGRHRAVRPAAIAHGAKEPYGIRLWCLGNEMDGPWQIGHKTAERVRPARRRDRAGDAAGRPRASSSSPAAAPAGHADLRRVGGDGARRRPTTQVDYISLHAYYEEHDGDRDSFLASAVDMERFIEAVVATCDHVGARLEVEEADQPLLRRVERLVPDAASRTPSRRATGRRRRG